MERPYIARDPNMLEQSQNSRTEGYLGKFNMYYDGGVTESQMLCHFTYQEPVSHTEGIYSSM